MSNTVVWPACPRCAESNCVNLSILYEGHFKPDQSQHMQRSYTMKKSVRKEIVSKPEAKAAIPTIRILRVTTALSLSGKSTLTFMVGSDAQSECYLKVSANSGGGFWSAEWISLPAIQSTLESIPKDTPITSYALRGLFSGKSVNSRGFLMSVLKHLGLVRPLQDKQRCYELMDPKPFLAEVKTLIDSGVALPAAEPSKHLEEGKKSASKGNAKPA
jgi:hypothetical protein